METPLEFAEVDPTGRYGRYDEILGKGSTKTVYRAFDELRGTEVAWNQVKLHDFLRSPEGLERLYSEIHLLRTLHHPGIMRFHDSWVDASRGNVNFVTEMFTSGTLRQYRHRHRRVRMAAVKHWCRQILEGLAYLHAHDPPIIHRDLKCDNIFVNGNQGEVKIGDLGLAAVLRTFPAARCVGTPEFMAPEVYEEQYNELVDIYSFGMCVLEMVTLEYPYSECNHYAEIYKKVTSGRKPEALYKVRDPEVRRFIDKCLASMSNRLSARELLEDPFLRMDDNLGPSPKEELVRDNLAAGSLQMQPSLISYASSENRVGDVVYDDALPEMEDLWGHDDLEDMDPGTRHFYGLQHGNPSELVVTIKGKRVEDGSIFLRLRILEEDRARNIYFQFDIEFDTALTVATEMVAQLEYLANFDVTGIAEMIDGELSSLMPDWKPGPGIEEMSEFSTVTSPQEFASRITSQMCSSNYVRFSKSNSSMLPSSHGDTRGQFLDGKGLLRRLQRSCSELPHSLDPSVVCSPLSKENSIAPEDRMNSSFKKCEVTFLQKSSSKAKGRFLCGSFRKVSMDLSEQGTLHRTFNGREGYEAELHEKIRLINLTHQLQPQKYRNDHIEHPLPVSLASLSVNVADSAGTSNPERLLPADCNEANPACIHASSSSELPHSSRRRGISMRLQSLRNRNDASRLVQNEREKGERGSMRIFAARKMLAGFLLPGCLPRTKSLKVDAINP